MIKLNVLISAYAVSPTWGSEPGMGWNWIINIAKYCNVHVITEGEWRNEILEAVKELPQKDNLHFYFNPVPGKVRLMCWNQGDWRFYWYYRKWQKKSLTIAKEIIAKNQIDIAHQLNMIGFREPGYFWKIKDIPLVWGPIGGMGNINERFLKDVNLRFLLFNRIKNVINNLQIHFHPRVRKMIKASRLIAATIESKKEIKEYYNKDSELINETGGDIQTEICDREFVKDGVLKVIWIGKFDFRKRLDIAIKSISASGNSKIELSICGEGTKEQIKQYKQLCESLDLNNRVSFLGKIPHSQILSLLRKSDLLLFSSIGDATSTVVSEAVSVGLPILSHNICGFGPIVDEYAGWAIPAIDTDTSIKEFGRLLDHLQKNPKELLKKSNDALENRYKLSWDYKMNKLLNIYMSVSKRSR